MKRSRRAKRAGSGRASRGATRCGCVAARSRKACPGRIILRLDRVARTGGIGIGAVQLRRLLADLRRSLGHPRSRRIRGQQAVSEDPDCVITTTEYRFLEDEQGNTYLARCDFYECDDGTSYWHCTPV